MSSAIKTLNRLVAADRLLNNTSLPVKERTAAYTLALHHAGLTSAVPSRKSAQKIVHHVKNASSNWGPAAQADADSIVGPVQAALADRTYGKHKQGAKTHRFISSTKKLLHEQPTRDTTAWEGALARIQTDNVVPSDWYYYRSKRQTQRVAAPGALQQIFMQHHTRKRKNSSPRSAHRTTKRRKTRSSPLKNSTQKGGMDGPPLFPMLSSLRKAAKKTTKKGRKAERARLEAIRRRSMVTTLMHVSGITEEKHARLLLRDSSWDLDDAFAQYSRETDAGENPFSVSTPEKLLRSSPALL